MSAVSTGNVIEKLRYSHEAMIDLIVARPTITQRQIAKEFGYTEGWISRILRSDSFREALATRTKELVDPIVLQNIEQRFEALVHQSLEILAEQLQLHPSADLALKSAELGARALGYGARQGAVNVTTNFVVAMPEKAKDARQWLDQVGHSSPVIEVVAGE